MDPPNTLKKNKNKIPIPIFTVLCAINRVGLIGAPTNNNKTINAIITEITTTEVNLVSSFFQSLVLHMTRN